MATKLQAFLGLNSKTDRQDVNQLQSIDCLNCFAVPQGGLATRAGYVKNNTTAYDGGILGIFYFKHKYGSNNQLIAVDDTGDVIAE